MEAPREVARYEQEAQLAVRRVQESKPEAEAFVARANGEGDHEAAEEDHVPADQRLLQLQRERRPQAPDARLGEGGGRISDLRAGAEGAAQPPRARSGSAAAAVRSSHEPGGLAEVYGDMSTRGGGDSEKRAVDYEPGPSDRGHGLVDLPGRLGRSHDGRHPRRCSPRP